MDLDNIKKAWQETNISPSIDEQKIEKMLSNEGHSAFNSLLKYEKLGRTLMIICLLIAYPVFSNHLSVFIIYTVSVILGFFWQLYKVRKLKEIDIAHQSITQISNQVYWYRKIIFKEFVIGIIWFVGLVMLLGYLEFSDKSIRPTAFIIAMSIAFIGVIITYKLLYWNNIKKLEEAIKEVEEFEKENI
ncbi:hypothetical protein [Dysgonomonas sp. Marseille-P4361]|uniref:hypothetical protein n=1 Tax=Dysgonomonas sp. Marseille-P4361 TaxID=2161820 RepID=UPI000D554A94|nr:hypothetical protein [Dysgonomonas sp. Marseille-P4361]